MTLDEAHVKDLHKILKVNCEFKETQTALQEMGIFTGASICKICENRAHCAIYQIYGNNKIMLHSGVSKFVEIENIS